MDWIQTDLIPDLRNEFPNETQFEPVSCVPSSHHWITPLISNTLASISDYPCFEADDHMFFYVALERKFDCTEKDCVEHCSWAIHIKRIYRTDETIGESIELACLTFHTEAWLESFLELKFPSIIFDYDSLMHEDSLPRLDPA